MTERAKLPLVCGWMALTAACGCHSGDKQGAAALRSTGMPANRGVVSDTGPQAPMRFYFGNLHAHTEYSDGEESPRAAYKWARDVLGLHFYAVTDHSERISAKEWRLTGQAAEDFDEHGRFVALRGFEHNVDFIGQSGHANIFATKDHLGIWDALSMDVDEVYEWVRQRNGLMQLNHPGRPSGVFDDLRLRSWANPWVFAIETGNKAHGNNSGRYLQYYQRALDAGWRLAPANNQDNHSLEITSHRTVILAPALSRAALLAAMRRRRLYSSDDPNMKVTFKLDQAWMGSDVLVDTDAVTLTIAVEDDEPITRVEVVTNRGAIAAERSFGRDRAVSWKPTVSVIGRTFLFVKVYQRNLRDADGGHNTQIAVTAPIWLRRPRHRPPNAP